MDRAIKRKDSAYTQYISRSYYSNTSSAYALEPDYEYGYADCGYDGGETPFVIDGRAAKPEKESKKRKLRKKSVKAEKSEYRQRVPVFSFLIAACIFTGMFGFLLSAMAISESKIELSSAMNELKAADDEVAELQADIYNMYDLNQIELTAASKLGMVKPEEYQIVYYSVPVRSYVTTYEQKPEPKQPEYGFFGFLNISAY